MASGRILRGFSTLRHASISSLQFPSQTLLFGAYGTLALCPLRPPKHTTYLLYRGFSSGVNTSQLYSRCVQEGLLRYDERQEYLAQRLSRLQAQLQIYSVELSKYKEEVKKREAHKAAVSDSSEQNSQQDQAHQNGEAKPLEEAKDIEEVPKPKVPRGLYVHGNVGVGKTVLMDMFFETTNIPFKRRMHFHEFMIETHSRIHAWKQERLRTKGRDLHVDLSPEGDAITVAARAIASESVLLAFDEFVVTDTADALILRHLFSELFAQGTVVVATSNTAPERLYEGGLNRHYFLPFISILQEHCKPVDMATLHDYRMDTTHDMASSRYYTAATRNLFEAKCQELFEGQDGEEKTIQVAFGRSLTVKRSWKTTCLLDFNELCGKQAYVGPADFQAVCKNFDTIIMENVPRLTGANHNEARRFVTFIDQVYDKRRKLYIMAETEMNQLCAEDAEDGVEDEENVLLSIKELNMALKRMRSRLMEMQDDAWPIE